jgi:Ni/Co efflux regulator RcnB
MKRLVLFVIVAVFALCTVAMAQVSTKDEVQSVPGTQISDSDKASVKDAQKRERENSR